MEIISLVRYSAETGMQKMNDKFSQEESELQKEKYISNVADAPE